MMRMSGLGACLFGWAFLLVTQGTACAEEGKVVGYRLDKIHHEVWTEGGKNTGNVTIDDFSADSKGGRIRIGVKCWHDNGPHSCSYEFTWKFDRDLSRIDPGQDFTIHAEGKRVDTLGATCPPGPWRAVLSPRVGRSGYSFPDTSKLPNPGDGPFYFTERFDSEPRVYPYKDADDFVGNTINGLRQPNWYSHDFACHSRGTDERQFPNAWGAIDFVWGARDHNDPEVVYFYLPIHEGEQPPPTDPGVKDGSGQGNNGKEVTPQGNPWDDPAVQRAIDEWLQRSHPGSPPHGSWTQWGQAIGDGVSAPYPPDHGGMGRYEYLWRHAAELHSTDMGTLAEYLAGKGSRGGPGGGGGGTSSSTSSGPSQGAGGGGVLPTPPAGSPEPAPASRTTLQAGARTVKKGGTVQVPIYLASATDLSNMNFEVAYDTSVVQLSGDPAKGDLLGSSLFDSKNAGGLGFVRIGFARSDGLSGSGVVALLTFQAVGSPGSRSALDLRVTTANATGGATPAVDVIPGVVEIEPEDNLNEYDSVRALAMSVGKLAEDLRLDVDKDGSVTSRDATLILQKLLERQGR